MWARVDRPEVRPRGSLPPDRLRARGDAGVDPWGQWDRGVQVGPRQLATGPPVGQVGDRGGGRLRVEYADVRPRPPLREIAKSLNAQFVLEGKVRDEAGHINIQVVLVDALLDRKVWVHDVGGTTSDIPELQRQIAQAASAAVLQRKR